MSMSKLGLTKHYRAYKPIVHYAPDKAHDFIKVGEAAFVVPVDHPATHRVTNCRPVYTSVVLRVEENGEFETRNTIYRPTDMKEET